MPRTRIKICGITDADALRAACDAGADAVGFVFIPRSRRFIEPEYAFALSGGLPPFVASVSLFADAPLEKFMEMEEVCPTTLTQLHGDEDVELAAQCGPGVLKTVRYDAATIADELARWDELDEVDAIVIDLPADPARWSGLVEPCGIPSCGPAGSWTSGRARGIRSPPPPAGVSASTVRSAGSMITTGAAST